MDKEKDQKEKKDQGKTAKEIINQAIFDAKTMRISMGSAVVNKLSKFTFLKLQFNIFIDLTKSELASIKNQAIEKLNRLENMINKKIDQGVTTLLERKTTIQDNPFFKKKQPMQGLHDLKETMKKTKLGGGKHLDSGIQDKVLTHKVRRWFRN